MTGGKESRHGVNHYTNIRSLSRRKEADISDKDNQDEELWSCIVKQNARIYVKFSLCLTKYQGMKMYPLRNIMHWKHIGGVEVQLQAFLTSALDESERSASRSGRFTPGESAPNIHWIGGWVDPRADLDAATKRKIPVI
jgi:hypothetical protein